MSFDCGYGIKEYPVKVDLNKIKRHEDLTGLAKLVLTEWTTNFSIILRVDSNVKHVGTDVTYAVDFPVKDYPKSVKNKQNERIKRQAESEYADMLKKIESGKYNLHVYDSCRLKVEFTE